MFGLAFLYPLFLIGALAVAIPIALHLFRRRTESVIDFPAVRLLHKAPVEQQRRRRLRELILLALRVAALVLLAFAFARPYFKSAAASAVSPVTVIALDVSMSMSAPGQFEAARQMAKKAVTDAPPLMLVALVTFSDSAALVVPPTTDRGGVLAAIDAASPTAGGTRFRTALGRAAEAIEGSTGTIVVVTDLQQAGWEAADEGAVPDGVSVEVKEVRGTDTNVALTAVRRDGQAVVAAVHNFGARPTQVTAHLNVDGREANTRRVDVAPQSAAEVRLEASIPPRGAIEITVDDVNGYQADNRRFLVLDPARAIPVIVLTADPPASSQQGLYIERALGVAGDGEAFHVRTIDGRQFSALSGKEVSEAAALIILGTRTLDRTGREMIRSFIANGGRLFVALGPNVDFDTLSDTLGVDLGVARDDKPGGGGTVTLVAVDTRHPIFRPFSSPTGALGDVYVERFRRLNDQKDRTVLARFSGGNAALTEQAVGNGRLLVFTSDLDNQWNRFPLNPAFVPFAVESVKYLTQGREQRQAFTLPDVPPTLVAGAAAPGIYSVPAANGSERRVAVNVDIRESNPARTTVEAFSAGITRLTQPPELRAAVEAQEQESRQRLWQFGLLAMLLALAAEGVLGRKAI